jgi:hypothetical protein
MYLLLISETFISLATFLFMFKPMFYLGSSCPKPCLSLLAATLLLAPSTPALAEHEDGWSRISIAMTLHAGVTQISKPDSLTNSKLWHQEVNMLQPTLTQEVISSAFSSSPPLWPQILTHLPDAAFPIAPEQVQTDPLDSPYPVPWSWVLDTQEQEAARGKTGIYYYRSPSLVSPDAQYAAYSRIEMRVERELYRSRVSSVMFLENLQTGELQRIAATSPLANHFFAGNPTTDLSGAIAILIPVSWSANSDRLLARQFEGIFSSSDASDFAVVWDRKSNRTTTIAPSHQKYDAAVLLGWSNNNPGQVLFRAGDLGDEEMPLFAVNLNGQTLTATEDKPMVLGVHLNPVWSGPQNK